MHRELVVDLMAADTVVCTGVGKSGKIAALSADLLQTVGCKAVFIHPTDMLHGSMNVVSKNHLSLVVMFTHSGFTEEIGTLHSHLREMRRPVRIAYVTSHPHIDDAEYVVKYDDVGEESATGTIPVLACISQIVAIGEYVNRIANIATPIFLAAGHPKGAIARKYERIIGE